MNEFVWGTGPNYPLYGLYLPVRDRFIVVYHDSDVLFDLRNLLSSKCNTLLINISVAPEYHPTIIDNTVCENWTIRNRDKLNFRYGIWDYSEALDGSTLGLKEQTSPSDTSILDLKEFSQTALQILLQIERLKNSRTKILDTSLLGVATLFFSSQNILPYHDDQLSRTMEESMESRYQEEKNLRQSMIKKYQHMIYWSRDQKELVTAWNKMPDIFGNLSK